MLIFMGGYGKPPYDVEVGQVPILAFSLLVLPVTWLILSGGCGKPPYDAEVVSILAFSLTGRAT